MRYQTWIIISLLLIFSEIPSQGQVYTYFYRVYFKDKGANSTSLFSPDELVSQRAIDRRIKNGTSVPDYSDLPVFKDYIDQVKALGFRLHCTSKWMNTGLFKTTSLTDISDLLALSCVAGVKIVKNNVVKSSPSDKLEIRETNAEIPLYDRPLTMVNGYPLLNAGYDGTDVLIAILDGGFRYADKASSLVSLRNRNGVRSTYDFVNRSKYVYDYHTHGTSVLSVIAGQITGAIRGTATGADFLLLRSEDTSSEFPVEEDFWAAAAEFADSAGADIISSSLGYCTFDDPSMNYKFSELDGNTAFVTRVADIAASKGILVVNSAGNERNKTWIRIIAPSDGDSVLAAGAVDGNEIVSSFSSAGPSADHQVKPDNVALGVNIVVQSSETQLTRANGTSFSCPVLSGLAACLMEAVPEAKNTEIIHALHTSSDRFNTPDSLYGYGIPDMVKAISELQNTYLTILENGSVAGPNPTRGEVRFVFSSDPGRIIAEIVSAAGVTMYKKDFGEYAGRLFRLDALSNMKQGIYFIRLTTDTGMFRYKIIKLNN